MEERDVFAEAEWFSQAIDARCRLSTEGRSRTIASGTLLALGDVYDRQSHKHSHR
jgi:hypothetical protein